MNEPKIESIHEARQLAEADEFATDRDVISVVTKEKSELTKSELRELIEEFRNREVI